MSETRYELERPVRCRGCDGFTKTVVVRVDATKVSDAVCVPCSQGVVVLKPRVNGRRGRGRWDLERKPRPEVLAPRCLN